MIEKLTDYALEHVMAEPEPVSRGRVLDGLNTAIYKALNAAGITPPAS